MYYIERERERDTEREREKNDRKNTLWFLLAYPGQHLFAALPLSINVVPIEKCSTDFRLPTFIYIMSFPTSHKCRV